MIGDASGALDGASFTSSEVMCLGEAMALITIDTRRGSSGTKTSLVGAVGAESNVAVRLAQLGNDASWVGTLGIDELGEYVFDSLHEQGVDMRFVERDKSRPTGLLVKPIPAGGVRYYRTDSAGSRLNPRQALAARASEPQIVHLSGVTPALSATAEEASETAIGEVKRYGGFVSFDVNYRPRLWPNRPTAAHRLLQLAQNADAVFVGLDEAAMLWGSEDPSAIRKQLPNVAHLVIKDGPVGATEYTADEHIFSPAHPTTIREATGAGDAFAAGWLHGWLHGEEPALRLNLGHVMANGALRTLADFPRHPIGPDVARTRASSRQVRQDDQEISRNDIL